MARSARHFALAAILVVAAGSRLLDLGHTPPGINHDEASNGYDAYSILKTGGDRWDKPWPVILEGFGRADHRGALYAYTIVPFHALVGPEHLILSTRLPAAVFGICTVACLYLLVSKLAGTTTALWAAFFLTLSPWHLQLSRFGHESSLTPACTVLALTLLAYASGGMLSRAAGKHVSDQTGLPPPSADEGIPPSRLKTLPLVGAGVIFALSLYAYPSMRLFTPAFVLLGAICYRHTIAHALRTRHNRNAVIIMLLTACLVAAPIASLTVTNWDKVMARAEQVSLFHQSDGFTTALIQCAKNYLAHFGPRWLITKGDPSLIQSPRAYGQLNVAIIPFLLVGLCVLITQRKQNPIYSLLLAWLLLHPIAAAVTLDGPHALRSACGLPVFQWIAAIGCHTIVTRISGTSRIRSGAAVVCGLAVTVNAALSFKHYFVVWGNDPKVVSTYQRDLCEAMRAIRPYIKDYDRVYISDQINRDRRWFSGEAYIIALLVLPVEPADFQRWPKSIVYERPTDGFHRVESFGPFIMTTRTDVMRELFEEHRTQRALIIARPEEISGWPILATVNDANGIPKFEIISVRP